MSAKTNFGEKKAMRRLKRDLRIDRRVIRQQLRRLNQPTIDAIYLTCETVIGGQR
jgi:hypothetical protein